jgi:hypothetical protein
MPIDRFELTHANRKVLGLDRGPPGPSPPQRQGEEHPDGPVEVGQHIEGVATDAAADLEAIEVEGGMEPAVVESANEPPSGMEQFDERGDAVSLGRNDREDGDDLDES